MYSICPNTCYTLHILDKSLTVSKNLKIMFRFSGAGFDVISEKFSAFTLAGKLYQF